jgi:hypothetical protein
VDHHLPHHFVLCFLLALLALLRFVKVKGVDCVTLEQVEDSYLSTRFDRHQQTARKTEVEINNRFGQRYFLG